MQDIFRGQWICNPQLPHDAVPVFKKTFSCAPNAQGTLTVTALGIYEAFLNGQRLGDYIFAPGWTSYMKRHQVQVLDISPFLKEENVLTVRVAQGWFCWDFGFIGDPPFSPTPLCLKCDIALTEEGAVRHIPSDSSFTVHEDMFVTADLYHGEVIDFDRRTAPVPAETFAWTDAALIPQEGDVIREQERLKPIAVTKSPTGEWIVDFGQNMTGYVCFSVDAKGGETMAVRHGEVLLQDGSLYTENLRGAKARMDITLKKGMNTLDRHLSFYGFRYIAVSGWPHEALDPDCFTAVVVHSDFKRTGHFECGDEDVNQLYHNILWGQKSNYLDVPTDCPQRDERLGWTGDAQVFIRAGAYNYDVKRFFAKWLRDVAADQMPDGGIPHTIPDSVRHEDPADREYSSAWADAACICPWQLYETYGDKQLLQEHFPMMKKWVDHIRAQGEREEMWNTGFHFGDWLGLDAQEGSYTGSTDLGLIATAMFANSTNLLIRAGHVLGMDVGAYEQLLPRIKQAFCDLFIRDGVLTSQTQTAHVLTLYFDLCKEDDRKKITDALCRLIHERDAHLTTGFVGTPYLLHVLSQNGHTDLAFKLLLNRSFPSWLFSVRMGATTMWEHWDSLKEDGSMWSSDMNSFNHYAYGAVGDWLMGAVLGINPMTPGYEQVLLTPHADKRLGYARGSFDTARGTVQSGWQVQDDSVCYRFLLPRGMTGKAVIAGEEYPLSEGETTLTLPL